MVCTFLFAPPVADWRDMVLHQQNDICLEAFFLRQLWQTARSPLQTWCRHSKPDFILLLWVYLSCEMWYCIRKMLRLFPRSWARYGKLRSRHCSCSGACKLGAAARNLFSNCFGGFTCLVGCGIASEKCYLFGSFSFFCASCGTLQWRLQARCSSHQNLFSKCLSGFTCLARCGIASEKCIL